MASLKPAAPLAMLMELTHRCPLRCAYCSNPLALTPTSAELPTAAWKAALDEAAQLGMLQVHFSGGEPMARADLIELVRHATARGLYSNLITSGLLLDAHKLAELVDAGLSHVQLSFQDLDEDGAQWVSGYAGGVAKKREVAERVLASGLALTLNFVMTRHNVSRLSAMLDYAESLGVGRVEVANTQYYGWGLKNRAALIPTREQLDEMNSLVAERRARCKGRMVIDYVIPDYYARRPKACMGGWGQRFINVMPDGSILPCHAAQTIGHLQFPRFPDSSLSAAWYEHPGFAAYRGTDWMPDPCGSCDHKEQDWGGCRCQALALAGDAGTLDPVCELSPQHVQVVNMAMRESHQPTGELMLRQRHSG